MIVEKLKQLKENRQNKPFQKYCDIAMRRTAVKKKVWDTISKILLYGIIYMAAPQKSNQNPPLALVGGTLSTSLCAVQFS